MKKRYVSLFISIDFDLEAIIDDRDSNNQCQKLPVALPDCESSGSSRQCNEFSIYVDKNKSIGMQPYQKWENEKGPHISENPSKIE